MHTPRTVGRGHDLDSEDRAELASELLASLDDGGIDDGVGEAWAEVIERRVQEVKGGHVELIDADEAMRRARERLHTGQ